MVEVEIVYRIEHLIGQGWQLICLPSDKLHQFLLINNKGAVHPGCSSTVQRTSFAAHLLDISSFIRYFFLRTTNCTHFCCSVLKFDSYLVTQNTRTV